MGIEGFDDIDDLLDRLDRDRRDADANVLPWQAEIKPGDYTVRLGPGFPIYSEILENPEERSTALQHFRFTRSYSIACPDGELGDIHVSTVQKQLTKGEFNRIRETGWAY